MVGVVAQPVPGQEVLGPIQVGTPQHLRAGDALMAEVVDRVTDPLIRQRLAVLLQSWQWITSGRLPDLTMNSSAALEKNVNRSASSGYPYSSSRPKKLPAECGSMKKHLRPCTWPNHTVQQTAPPCHGTHRS